MPISQKLIGIIGSVAISAAGAGLFVQMTSAPIQAQSRVAGIEMMRMVRDEHALVAETVAQKVQIQREANLAADRDAASLRIAAAEPQAETPAINVAEAKHVAAAIPPARKLASREPPIKSETAQPPLQLAALMEPSKPPPRAGTIVTRQIHSVVATVERVPAWMVQAANWVVELPAQALPRLTQRRHFSITL